MRASMPWWSVCCLFVRRYCCSFLGSSVGLSFRLLVCPQYRIDRLANRAEMFRMRLDQCKRERHHDGFYRPSAFLDSASLLCTVKWLEINSNDNDIELVLSISGWMNPKNDFSLKWRLEAFVSFARFCNIYLLIIFWHNIKCTFHGNKKIMSIIYRGYTV